MKLKCFLGDNILIIWWYNRITLAVYARVLQSRQVVWQRGVNLCLVRASSAPPLCLLFLFFFKYFISLCRPACPSGLPFHLKYLILSLLVSFYLYLSFPSGPPVSSSGSLSRLFLHLKSAAPFCYSGCEAQIASLCSKKHVAETPGGKRKASTEGDY